MFNVAFLEHLNIIPQRISISSELSRNLRNSACTWKTFFSLMIYFYFFPNFFPKLELPNLGGDLSASVSYTLVFTVYGLGPSRFCRVFKP